VRNLANLLENVLILIPLAILIFVRVFSQAVKAKAKAKAEQGDGALRSTRGAGTSAPSSDGARKSPFKGLAALFQGRASETSVEASEPLHFELRARAAERQKPRVAPSGRYELPVVSPEPSEPPAASAPGKRAPSVAPEAFAFPSRVEALAPLKRAFVFGVVLGRPRALEPDHRAL